MSFSPFKIIVAGTRTFNDYQFLKQSLDTLLTFFSRTLFVEVVCGGCSGADRLGKQYAVYKGYYVKEFPADWTRHGKCAGAIRNLEMARYADLCVVFWDGKSKGAKNMIDTAVAEGLLVKVFKYTEVEP
jgi:hypothetical protein